MLYCFETTVSPPILTPAPLGEGFFFFVLCAFLYQPAGKAAEQTLLAISICIEAFGLSVMKSGDMLCVLGGSSSWLMFSMNFYSETLKELNFYHLHHLQEAHLRLRRSSLSPFTAVPCCDILSVGKEVKVWKSKINMRLSLHWPGCVE